MIATKSLWPVSLAFREWLLASLIGNSKTGEPPTKERVVCLVTLYKGENKVQELGGSNALSQMTVAGNFFRKSLIDYEFQIFNREVLVEQCRFRKDSFCYD